MQFVRRNFALVAFWVAVAILLGWRLLPSLIGIQVFSGYDMLDRFAPWSALETAGDSYTSNPYITDLLDSQGPALVEIRERLAAGDWPLQSNLVQGGVALLATPSLGFLIPPRLAWLVLPLAIAPAWVKLIELLFSVGFTYLLARRLGFHRLAASVSGFVAGFFGFAVAWNGWPQSSVIAMAPMLFWAVERFIQQRRWRDLAPVALASFFLLIGGFPAVAGHTFIFAGLYALVRALIPDWKSARDASGEAPRSFWSRIGDLLRLAVGVILGAVLSLFQLLPFVELTIGGASLDYRDGWSSIQDGPSTWLTTILPRSVVTSAAFQDQAAYVGAVAFLLIALGLLAAIRGALPRGVGVLLVAMSLFVVAFISFQSVFNWGAYVRDLPLLANNPPGRLRAQLAIPASIMAGLGVQWLMAVAPRGEWRGPAWLKPGFTWTTAVAGLLVAAAFGLMLWRYVPFAKERGIQAIQGDLLLAVVPLAVVVVLLVLAAAIRHLRTLTLAVVAVSVVAQAALVTAFYWPTSDPDEIYPESETLAFLAENVGHDQLATAGLVMRPNVPNVYGIRLVNGHGFASDDWRETLEKADPFTFSMGGTYSIFRPDRVAIFENPTLDAMGVRYVAAAADEYLGAAGVPVPLGGEQEELTTGTAGTQTLDASGMRSVYEGEWTDINGVVVPMTLSGEVTVEARALDHNGEPIAENLLQFNSPGTEISLPVALAVPEDAVVAAIEVAVTPETVDDTLAQISLPVAADGTIAAQVNLNTADTEDYPVVYAGENVIVWERETALNRIRLSENASGAGQLSDDRAQLAIKQDNGDVIQVAVKSDADAYLTVVQSLNESYRATVDGNPAEIQEGENGAYVVPVPAGDHEVVIEFAPRSVPLGAALSGAGLVVFLAIALAGPIRDWRRGRRVSTMNKDPK